MTATPDWSRDDVTRVLVEKLGFTPDPYAPGIMFLRGENLRLSIVDAHGTLQLAHNNPLWAVNFTSSVPASVILQTVRQAAAEDDRVYCRHCSREIAEVPAEKLLRGTGNEVYWWHIETGKSACPDGNGVAEPKPED